MSSKYQALKFPPHSCRSIVMLLFFSFGFHTEKEKVKKESKTSRGSGSEQVWRIWNHPRM